MVSSRVNWPALRFPPINLWVMPPWQRKTAHAANLPAHQSHAVNGSELHEYMQHLLAARGGCHA